MTGCLIIGPEDRPVSGNGKTKMQGVWTTFFRVMGTPDYITSQN
jgi:hypothetical protein